MALAASTDPAVTGNYVDVISGLADEAATAGLTSAWFGQRFDYDAATLAALVGRSVPGLEVGTSAIPIFGRHPFGRADFRGELITAVTPAPMGGKLPGADPAVPVLVAAIGPQALRASGELADGILPFLAGPAVLDGRIVPAVRDAARSAGRADPRIVAFVAAVVTDDPSTVYETAAVQMGFYDAVHSYAKVIAEEGVDRAADLALIGDEDTVAGGLRRYADAGVTEIVLTQTDLGGDAARRRTWALAGDLALA